MIYFLVNAAYVVGFAPTTGLPMPFISFIFRYSYFCHDLFLVNAAYVVGFAPTTGLPMPFISYGGSHTIFTFLSMGILLNIARKGRSVTNSYYRGFSYE